MGRPLGFPDQIPANVLKDLKVLNLAVEVPGPWAAARLAAFGADVVEVEPPTGDPLETWSPSWHRELTAGATVERADTKSGSDRTQLNELLDGADVLVTTVRPSMRPATVTA